MRTIHCAVTVLLLTLGQNCYSDSPPEYGEECIVWRNVTHILNTEANVEMTCTPNVQCTGYDCTGQYSYSGPYSLGGEFTQDYCYGMAIHPCDTPVDMHFYVEFPDENSTFQTFVHDPGHGQSFIIPGATYDIGSLGSSQAFVVVDMNRTQIQGKTYLELGLKVKVRVRGLGGYFETWPHDLQRTLMPDMMIPVPNCDSSVQTPKHKPYTCAKNILSTTVPPPKTTMAPGMSTTTVKPATGGNTTDLPMTTTTTMPIVCKLREMDSCGHNAMCRSDNISDTTSGTGHCVCIPNYWLNHTKCVPIVPTKEPIFIPDVVPGGPHVSKKNAIIIACSVVAVVVIITALVVFVVYKYYKHKQTYGQHALLLTSDDDDPLDISS